MTSDVVGSAYALSAAAIWAVSPMLMASAGRKVGSFPVLLLRSLLVTLMFAVAMGVQLLVDGTAPALPTWSQSAWLAVSGIIGMGVGDILIYESFVTLGARRTSQVLVLAPAVAVVVAWFLLGERLSLQVLGGVSIVLAGTFYAVLAGQTKQSIAAGESGDVPATNTPRPKHHKGEPGTVTTTGVLFAIGGAACMAVGAVLVRRAFRDGEAVDRVVATFIRVTAAGIFLWLIPVVRNQVRDTLALLRNGHIMTRVGIGTFLGPGIGMFCYVAALQATEAGRVSTLVATTPLFAIPVTMLRYRVRIRWDVCLAALIAVYGVKLMVSG